MPRHWPTARLLRLALTLMLRLALTLMLVLVLVLVLVRMLMFMLPMPQVAPVPRKAAHRARQRLQARAASLTPAVRGLMWAAASGAIFCVLNATMRVLAQQLHPMQTLFLRYLFGVLVLLPMLWHAGLAAYKPNNPSGQFWRGAVHTLGLVLWFTALPHIPLADTTAIGFTGPLFIMMGALWFLREPMHWERWLATGVGFIGVLIVLAPKLALGSGGAVAVSGGDGGGGLDGGGDGGYHLLMLASAPVFAASFLITKVLTRSETTGVIVFWQALTVTVFCLPLALWVWQPPSLLQWLGFVVCGALGSSGHYCLTRSFRVADISSTQSVKFLDLVWSAALGWLMFAELPAQTTLAGGVLICAATLWVARREQGRKTGLVITPANPPDGPAA
jgi:drug/metabolite transporter (DMT)-like permease